MSLGVPLRIAGPRGQAPARVDPADVTARYDKGLLEVSVPVKAVKPEGTRITVENADAVPEQPPDRAAVPEQPPDQAG